MRLRRSPSRSLAFLAASLLAAAFTGACGDDGAATGDTATATDASNDQSNGPDGSDATATGDDTATAPADGTTTSPADTATAADTSAPVDVVEDPDVPNPQADAYKAVWSARLVTEPAGVGHVHGLRYVGGSGGGGGGGATTPSVVLALIEVPGTASLDFGDGDATVLPGEGHRLVLASIAPDTGVIGASAVRTLGDGESIVNVDKAGAGYAAAIHGAAGDVVVVGQAVGAAVRLAEIALAGGAVGLPAQSDMQFATTSVVTTALALDLDVPAEGGVLMVTAGEEKLSYEVAGGGALGYLMLAAPAAEVVLPSEGSALIVADDVVAEDVAETRSGPVVLARTAAATTIGATALEADERAIVIGALDENNALTPYVLWHAPVSAGTVDLIQLAGASQGGGLVLAGKGAGELSFGPDTLSAGEAHAFIAALGSAGGLLYEAPACDQILGVSVSFQYRILKVACDVDGEGPGLVLTSLTTDLGGNLQDPIDQLLVPMPSTEAPTLLSGIVSFTVTDGRASGALVDLGKGPRLLLVRQDGQPYDSGILPALVRDGASSDRLFFATLRSGGGGGGGNNANTNAVVFAVPRADGTVIGRARIDLKTLIW